MKTTHTIGFFEKEEKSHVVRTLRVTKKKAMSKGSTKKRITDTFFRKEPDTGGGVDNPVKKRVKQMFFSNSNRNHNARFFLGALTLSVFRTRCGSVFSSLCASLDIVSQEEIEIINTFKIK